MFGLRNLAVVALSFAAVSCASATRVADNAPDPNVIRMAEAQLDPVCGSPLSAYDRYYAPSRFEGRDVVVARFVVRRALSLRRLTSNQISGVQGAYLSTEQNLPACSNRELWHGCGIVHLMLDAKTGALVSGEPPQGGLSLVITCYSVT